MFSSVNFTGFDDATIEDIKEDCIRFLDFTIPAEYVQVSGEAFGNSNTYHVMPLGRGDFHVQVCEPGMAQIAYKYGIAFFVKNGITNMMPYHHPMD